MRCVTRKRERKKERYKIYVFWWDSGCYTSYETINVEHQLIIVTIGTSDQLSQIDWQSGSRCSCKILSWIDNVKITSPIRYFWWNSVHENLIYFVREGLLFFKCWICTPHLSSRGCWLLCSKVSLSMWISIALLEVNC